MEETAAAPEAAAEQTVPSENAETQTSEAPEMVVEGADEVQPETLYADKFKSVSDLEKSYKELQSTFSKKLGAFEGAPEDGYKLSEEIMVGEEEAPLVDMLQEWGKEHQLSNDGLNSLATKYAQYQEKIRDQKIHEEFKKLGPEADARVSNVRAFLEKNIGEDLTVALAGNMNTAAAVEAVEKMISLTKQASPAPVQGNRISSAEEIKAMRFAVDDNGVRKMEDPKYRAEVLRLEAMMRGQ